jgi:hypothetical protein
LFIRQVSLPYHVRQEGSSVHIKLFTAALVFSATSQVAASEVNRSCQGNIETSTKKILQAGVAYKLSYEISGKSARIRFAGREFETGVELGKSWKGPWLKRMDDSIYFSYLPEDGGTVKFQFELDRWFSGNC